MQDDNGDSNDDVASIFSRSAIMDLVSGRQTIFCCLSCGIPFALSNDAYIYRDEKIQEFVRFTHSVRKQVSLNDRTRGSSMQWQLNLAHYLHRYLHRHIKLSAASASAEEAGGESRREWRDQAAFVQGATHLIACIQSIIPPKASSNNQSDRFFQAPPIVMDDAFMDITSPCCHACSISASHTVKIKKALGIYQKKLLGGRLPGKCTAAHSLTHGSRI